ncbi:DUF2789 domain-containing protein [Alkalimonas collagenimarina]|uniref:DUF2789 domain-containing protein n=1 Tax=Alkalimonas collagenimarina TaxID=400390 RepID=A0ABT9GV35_9GAMM|nr:DUF2789 domain-containing protein [Alkalimonas collagenimarina]MDP4534912.1 DUF2789 domain-containing protein [Alkalimonas collagenimarina]
MDTSTHTLSTLFAQLGLDNDQASIDQFVQQHKLAEHVHLADAPFWSKGQASFIAESLKEDADWAEVIDELNALLH